MIESLIAEFEHEASGTRKLLQAIPEKDITYRPSPKSWTMGELAQHIASIYHWYSGVFSGPQYDLTKDNVERGSPEDLQSILQFFETSVDKAREALKNATEESLKEKWTMKFGDQVIMDSQPRSLVIRGFLYNHLYHHRGEMIVYLRATGNKVPGLYGPTAEDMAAMAGK